MSTERTFVSRELTLPAKVAEVWALAGDFHGVDKWHPAVTASTREHVGGEEFRLLALADGGHLLEHLEDQTGHSYRYAILRGPLPVKHYHATLEAAQHGAGTVLTWSSSFEPTAPDAEAIIGGIYEAGFATLSERFGG